MNDSSTDRPQESWKQIEAAVKTGDAETAAECLESFPAGESARALSHLDQSDQEQLLAMLPDQSAAALMEELPDAQAAQLIARIPVEQAAAIVGQMESDEQVDLLHQIRDHTSEAILNQMAPSEAENIRFLSKYDSNSAGGLMVTEYLVFDEYKSVGDVLSELRQGADTYGRYQVQYVYVTTGEGRLVGVLRLRDLVLSSAETLLKTIMIRNPSTVRDITSLEDLQHLFHQRPLFGIPVVDDEDRLLGIVRQADIEQAGEEQAGRTMLRFAGILGGEELRSMPLLSRCRRRLSWLSINIVLNVAAASVIALYEDTLTAVIALAVFLPIVSDMSGCSGNQAVAVSMRELVQGVIRPRDLWQVVSNEASLGIVNGLALGLLLGLVGFVWKGNVALGLVVGAALAANTLVAVCLGSLIPLLLRGLKLDPAIASGPLLTTVTDMCGFFFLLSFAQMMLPYLTV